MVNINYNTPTIISPTQFTCSYYSSTYASGTGGTITSAGSATTETTQQASAQGGVTGLICPLPSLLQFTNKMVLTLGNGYPPQEYLDPSAGGGGSIVPVSNT